MMIRCLMLALTLMLITLSAAYLGRDEQIRQVLQRTKIPVEASSAAQIEPHFVQAESQPSGESSSSVDEPPRFIADEPMEPSSPPIDEQKSAVPTAPPLDPSTETRLYPIESEEQQYTPTSPTEEQKLSAAEPFVKELFELTEESSEQLKSVMNQAIYDYLSTDPSQRSDSINALIEKYTPIVLDLEAETDKQAEAILLRMTAALTAINADDGLVQDARAAYEYSKQQQTEHYTELLSSFSVE
ncbi:MAG: hypothetical protein IJF25_07350 [Oscillospiraceae bacterium]|nr:hypothetical protein [Oscillospiraceae bacterium]